MSESKVGGGRAFTPSPEAVQKLYADARAARARLRGEPDIAGRDVSLCAGFPPAQEHTEPGHPTYEGLADNPSLDDSQERVSQPDPELERLLAEEQEIEARAALKAVVADALYRRRTLSDRALDLINGPRADEYAPPELNLPRIGQAWAAVLGLPEAIPGHKVALMMAALKCVRAAHSATDDSLVDLVGYAELAERLRP